MDAKTVFTTLFEKYGAVAIDLADAAPLFKYPTPEAAAQAVHRQTFPVPVRTVARGGKRLVSLADVADWLCGTPELKRGPGRPRKTQQQGGAA